MRSVWSAGATSAGYVLQMLAEPAQSLTDLALGLVVTWLALRLRRRADVHRHWVASFAWGGVAGLAGAVHPAVLVRWTRGPDVSWSLITVMIVVAVSYLLGGVRVEGLGNGHAWRFWLLGSI